jgi:hypothetical protein
LQLKPDVVFLLSDADDLAPDRVPALLRLNAGRAVLHVIELSRGRGDRPEGPLAQLARDTGGDYQRVAPER